MDKWYEQHVSLVKEWSVKNAEFRPEFITHGSDKKVWWTCKEGHHWVATVINRIKGSGCPFCSGRMATPETCLAYKDPQVSEEWHQEKNGTLNPENICWRSNKKVWWKCKFGHEWQAVVYNRTRGKTSCPYCQGKLATPDNCVSLFPILVEQWSDKNELGPERYCPKSHKKVWWVCPKGHEYKSAISSRVHLNTGCPICAWQTSKLEIRVYCELKELFKEVSWRNKSYGFEIDVLLVKEKVAIEIDGWYWHKDKVDKDKEKSEIMKSLGLTPIHIRGLPLPLISEHDFSFKKTTKEKVILDKLCQKLTSIGLDRKINTDGWLNDEEYKLLVNNH